MRTRQSQSNVCYEKTQKDYALRQQEHGEAEHAFAMMIVSTPSTAW